MEQLAVVSLLRNCEACFPGHSFPLLARRGIKSRVRHFLVSACQASLVSFRFSTALSFRHYNTEYLLFNHYPLLLSPYVVSCRCSTKLTDIQNELQTLIIGDVPFRSLSAAPLYCNNSCLYALLSSLAHTHTVECCLQLHCLNYTACKPLLKFKAGVQQTSCTADTAKSSMCLLRIRLTLHQSSFAYCGCWGFE